MKAQLLPIGFKHYIEVGKIVAVANPKSAPMRRMLKSAREKDVLLDLTEGRRVKAIIFTMSKYVVLSAIEPATLNLRVEGYNAE